MSAAFSSAASTDFTSGEGDVIYVLVKVQEYNNLNLNKVFFSFFDKGDVYIIYWRLTVN